MVIKRTNFLTLDASMDFDDIIIPFSLECVQSFFNERPLIPDDFTFANTPLLFNSEGAKMLEYPLDKGKEVSTSSEIFQCQICGVECQGLKQYQTHLVGKKHKFMCKKFLFY